MALVEVAKARRDIRDAEVSVPKQHLRHRDTMLLNELPDGVPACLRRFRKTGQARIGIRAWIRIG